MDEQELDLLEVWKVFKKRKWLIIYTTVLCTVIVAAISSLIITPVYEAVTRIVIVKDSAKIFYEDRYTESDVMMYQKLVKTYVEIAKSDSVIDQTANSFSQYSADKIKKSLNAVSKDDTQILELSVKNSNPELAANIANTYADNFIKESNDVLPAGQLSILDKAKVPEKPVSPQNFLNTAIAFFMGLMVSIGIAFLLECSDTTITTEDQIEKKLNIPVLGVITDQP